MANLFVIILVVAYLIWLITEFAPLPPWVKKVAFIVWATLVTMLLAGFRITIGGME